MLLEGTPRDADVAGLKKDFMEASGFLLFIKKYYRLIAPFFVSSLRPHVLLKDG